MALTVEWAVHAGVPGAQAALTAMTPFLVNRFLQPAGTFSPFNATCYYLPIGTSGTHLFTTWAQAQQAAIAAGVSNSSHPPGTWQFDYGVAATSVVRGL
ncbi:MAG TPA: hypothetical protein VIK18_07665, partial [Pirellulales bacterium]